MFREAQHGEYCTYVPESRQMRQSLDAVAVENTFKRGSRSQWDVLSRGWGVHLWAGRLLGTLATACARKSRDGMGVSLLRNFRPVEDQRISLALPVWST